MKEHKPYILVTGSSGFLGRALCHYFGSKGHQMVGFDMSGPPSPPPNTDCLFCDLTSDESVQKTFRILREDYGTQITAVFHLAAYYDFSGKESPLYKSLTVDGTERMLRELKQFDVGEFIFSSSMLIYKPNEPGEPLTETSPVDATWQYPKSKVDTEKLIREQHGSMKAAILRIAGVYDDLCQSIPLAHQIQRIYEKQLEGHLYSGNTNVRQAFVHVDDIVSSFEAILENSLKLSDYAVFNIGENHAMSYQEIQNEVSHLIDGKDWTTIEVPKSIAKVGAWVENELPTKEKPFIKPWMIDRAEDNFEVNTDKAYEVLNWLPRHTLRATLPKMIEGLKVDPLRWYKMNHLTPPGWLKDREDRDKVA